MEKNSAETPAPARPVWEELEPFLRGKIREALQEMLEEEVAEFLGRGRSERRAGLDVPAGYRNGHGKPRKLSTAIGVVQVARPRVRDTEQRFVSRLLPLFATRTLALQRALPELYLHGLSKGDFELALRALLGEKAPLSATSMERLKAKWKLEYDDWNSRDLSDRQPVYLWADGVYVKAGLEKDKAALLVIIAAMKDGTKEVLAVSSGYRESTESWLGVLRGLRDRGLLAPRLATADGNTGFWAAVGQVWPQVAEQRCWNHKIVNVLDQLPKKLQNEAKELLCRIPNARSKQEAAKLRDAFGRRYQRVNPNAMAILMKDWERMVSFYDFPEEHWRHLRTTNIIESPFSAVRLRTKAAKRFKSRENATALIWKVLLVVERRFRKLNASELLADVFHGKRFINGKPHQAVTLKDAARCHLHTS